MSKIHLLPQSSSRLLTSSQIISSIFSVVKELVENALDSGAKNIEIKLEDFGLEKIEVKDNGSGIDKKDIEFAARPHFTSKITSFSDLESVSTYGFRGEALSAVCAVSDFSITTKSSDDNFGSLNNFGKEGQLLFSKPCPCPLGTTVSVLNIFKNLPVRRQYYRLEKNKKDEIRKIEELLKAYGVIENDIRFALYHNKSMIWQKSALPDTKSALIQTVGNTVFDHMEHVKIYDEHTQRKIELFLPKPDAPMSCGFHSSSKSIVVVNKRPVRLKAVDRILKDYYNESIKNTGRARYPICYISFTLPSVEVDVNVEPNKTCVMLNDAENILAQFSKVLKDFYKCEEINEKSTQLITCDNATLNGKQNEKQTRNGQDFLTSFQETCESNIVSRLALEKDNIDASKSFVAQKGDVLKLTNDSNSLTQNYNSTNSLSTTFNHLVHSQELSKHPVLKSVCQSLNSMSKKDINRVVHTKEPSKKRQKTDSPKSVKDFDQHLKTLNEFFGNNEISNFSSTPNETRAVTVQRLNLNQNPLQVKSNSCFDSSMKESHSYTVTKDINVASSDLSSVNHEMMDFVLNDSTLERNANENNCALSTNIGVENKKNEYPRFGQENITVLKSNSVVQKQQLISNKDDNDKIVIVEDVECSAASKNNSLQISAPVIYNNDNSSKNGSDGNMESQLLWSRGVLRSDENVHVQPVVVLQPAIVTAPVVKPKETSKTNTSKKSSPKQTSLCFERKITVFELFCRNNRLEVAAENPELNNQQIAQLLSEKWGNLSAEEKAIYGNMMDKNYPKEVKKKERLSKTISQNLSQDKKSAVISKSTKKKFSLKPRSKSLTCDLQQIRRNFASKKSIKSYQGLNIINYIAPGMWVCEKNNKLFSLNVFRVQETIIYNRLLDTFQFETVPLEVPVKISTSHLGDEAASVLHELKSDSQGNIFNEHLTANGFSIKRVLSENGQIDFEFTGIANCGSFYGVFDLKEILLLLKTKGPLSKLSDCRPSKVQLYLQGEAHRMSRKNPACKRKQDVEDLLHQKDVVIPLSDVCIHHKPFFHEIWDMNKTLALDV